MLLGFMLCLRALVNHIDFHYFIRGDEPVVERPAAIMRRFQFIENRIAVFVDAIFINGAGNDLPHYGETV